MNQLKNMTILKISGKIKKDFKYNDVCTYEAGDEVTSKISLQYSNSGVCNAFVDYHDKPIAKAGGYGYDKEGVALASAVNNMFGLDIKNTGEGLDKAIKDIRESGYTITQF